MTSSYTLNKKIEKPGYNDYASSPTGWSAPVNADWDIIDKCFGGVLSKNATGSVGTVNLTITEAQNLIINISGAMTGNAIYTLPANADASGITAGQWIVYNNTTGNYTVTIAPVSGGGSSVVCTQGKRTAIYSDGTNVAPINEAPTQIVPSGTKMLFQQTAAPTGWTKDTTNNNKALRVVSGDVVGGGTVDFTTAFASKTVAGTVGNTTLTVDQLPTHAHSMTEIGSITDITVGAGAQAFRFRLGVYGETLTSWPTADYGGNAPHNHTFTGTAIDLAVKYVDIIIATKN